MKQKAGVIATELEDMVNQAIATVHELLALLESELCAIKKRDIQELIRLSELKHAKIASLEQIETHRIALLKAIGYGTDPQGMEQCVAELGHHSLATKWQGLVALLSELQKQNRINGSVVSLTHRFVERSLHILQGGGAEDHLYGPSGQTTTERQARSIAKI